MLIKTGRRKANEVYNQTKIVYIHFVLMPLENARIYIFSLWLWVKY